MAVSKISPSAFVGAAFEFLPAGTYADLTARSNRPATCPRMIVAMAAQNWTVLKGPGGLDSPPGAVYAGFQHLANTSAITCDGAIGVYW